MRFEKKAALALCATFMAMLIVPLMATDLRPGVVSEIENRTLKPFPALFDADGGRNRDLISGFEGWFDDHIGFREEMFTLNARIQYDLFHSSGSERVLTGQDGWLFYTGDDNLTIAEGNYPNFDESVLADICQVQQRIAQELAGQGIEYVIVLPPSKISISPERLRGDFEVRETPVDILADYLEACSDLKVVRLKQALLEEKAESGELLYYKTDTHWNARGVYSGYREIVRLLNGWGIVDTGPVDVSFLDERTLRDLTNMIVGDDERYHEYAAVSVDVHDPAAEPVEAGELISRLAAQSGARRTLCYSTHDPSRPSFLVLGDSMFLDSCMTRLLAENCSELTGLWTYDLTQELLDATKPDVVFFEMTERLLNLMGSKNRDLAQASVLVERDGDHVDIYYRDHGDYPRMWFPTWSEQDGQDDLVWYEAKRSDEAMWHVRVELSHHPSTGIFNVHFYQGTCTEDLAHIRSETFEIAP